jgi:CheY-like chemotaxis protein
MAKLMLVEDDNNLREIYEARLQAEGYTIVSARDGEEALVIAKTEKPDLIISDVMMPKISGFEMLDILRNTEDMKSVKVIMLTALGQSDDQERANHLGADRYLVKSQVTLEDIVKVAHELLNDGPAPAEIVAPSPPPVAPAPPPVAPSPPPAEPVAPAPPPVAPSPPPAPVTSATDSSDAVEAAAQTEAKEASDVQTKIEDFVAGASEEASVPVDQIKTPPAEPVAPAPAVTDDASVVKDNKDDFVKKTAARLPENTNNENNESDEDSVAGRPTVIEPKAASEKDDDEKSTSVEAGAAAGPDEPGFEKVTIAHKKVIKPLVSAQKHDIEALFAEEQAKSGAVLPNKIVTGSGSKDDEKPDPHSIAL